MDLTLDFLRMSVPLKRLVKGVPGYEIPEEIGAFACDALEQSVPPDQIDERLELFHQAHHTIAASYKRTFLVLQYAYYWLRRMVLQDMANSPKRQAFMAIRLHSAEDILFAVDRTGDLLREHQDYMGEDFDQHSATELGLAEALSDFKSALKSAQSVFHALKAATAGRDDFKVLLPQKQVGPFIPPSIVASAQPVQVQFMAPLGAHFSQLAWRATGCVCEYFAPNGSYVNQEDHEPYHRQWQRIAVEILDMCVTLKLPDFTDPGYFPRAVAPSLKYFRETRAARSQSPIALFQSQTPERCG